MHKRFVVYENHKRGRRRQRLSYILDFQTSAVLGGRLDRRNGVAYNLV